MSEFFQSKIFELSFNQFLELLPFLILVGGFGLSVVGAALKFPPRFFKLTGVLLLGLAIIAWALILFQSDEYLLGLHVSKLTRVVGVICSIFAVACFGLFNVADRYHKRPEWLALLFLCVLALSLLPTARDWISFFVFLEFFSIPAYILVGYDTDREHSLEALLKYLLSGTFSSALLLMGIALTYLNAGSVDYLALSAHFPNGILSSLALLFLLAGILFKMTIAPFHFWAPDVYQGAPTGVAAFLAAGTKLSVFSAAAVAFSETGFMLHSELMTFAVIAGSLSIVLGSFLAFSQRSFRRMLAYSGTVNAGMLAPLMVSGYTSISSGVFFLFIYGATIIVILGPFSQIVSQRGLDPNGDLDPESFNRKDSEGASISTLILSTALFSLAGIPPLPGFFAKYWIFSDLWMQGQRQVVVLGLLATLMGVAYYIRIAGKFFFADKREIFT